jgi:general secretion pathway protein L
MSVGSLTSSTSRLTEIGANLVRRAGQWWLQEFLAFFPQHIAEWIIDSGAKSLLLSGEGGAVRLQVRNERRRSLATTRINGADYAPDVIDAFLRAQRLGRADVSIGVQLPSERVFARKLLLPTETERLLDHVLVQDLLTKTPFRLEDIYHDHIIRRFGDRLHVWQWVVRRQFVADVIEELGLQTGELAFVETDFEGDGPRPCIRLKRARSNQGRDLRWALAILTASAFLLAGSAVGLKYHRQQQVLDALAGELTATRAKAQSVRAAMNKLEAERAGLLRLRAHKEAPNLLDAWEEISRILPAHSWLTELHLSGAPAGDEQQLAITGFSPAAASLVGLIDRSPLFRDAALTSQISVDATEGKERFAIQAKLRADDPLRTAAR